MIDFKPINYPLYSVYEGDDGNKFTCIVVGFGFRKLNDGEIYVFPMDMDSVGCIDECASNLIGFQTTPILEGGV